MNNQREFDASKQRRLHYKIAYVTRLAQTTTLRSSTIATRAITNDERGIPDTITVRGQGPGLPASQQHVKLTRQPTNVRELSKPMCVRAAQLHSCTTNKEYCSPNRVGRTALRCTCTHALVHVKSPPPPYYMPTYTRVQRVRNLSAKPMQKNLMSKMTPKSKVTSLA